MYRVRKLEISSQKDVCDTIALESGKLYSTTVKFFWRTVNRKGLWLKPKSLMRLFTSNKMQAHSADASVQQFFHALNSWREARKTVPTANPPRKLKKYTAVTWKKSAIFIRNSQLILSNGKITEPLIIEWNHPETPVLVTLHWDGSGYELVFCYEYEDTEKQQITTEKPIGLDIGQINMIACSNGTILNGRLLRSLKQGRERSQAILQKRMSYKKEGSESWKKLRDAKQSLCKKVTNQARDILHKYTTGLVMYLQKEGCNTLVVGDLTGYRVENDKGPVRNQENHAWMYAQISWYLKYKWENLGLKYVPQEESYTSRTCPCCGNQIEVKGRNYICPVCGFRGHRDLVGATNILRKYLGSFGKPSKPVDGLMARPSHVRYKPNMSVAYGLVL